MDVTYQQVLDNNAGASSSVSWSVCLSCGVYYTGWHNCSTVTGFPVPQPVYYWPYPLPAQLSDVDVDRIARRVAELLKEA